MDDRTERLRDALQNLFWAVTDGGEPLRGWPEDVDKALHQTRGILRELNNDESAPRKKE